MAASSKMYKGEVPRLVVSVYALVLFGGFARFLEKIARPLAEPYGSILLNIRDAELEPEKSGIKLDVTSQHIKLWLQGGEPVRVLKRGDMKTMPLKEMQRTYDEGIRLADELAEAVADGLEFYTELGDQKCKPLPTWYASDSVGKSGKNASVGQAFLDGLRFACGFAMVFIGITTGLFYTGGRNTVAALHLEDVMLESLNYVFSGNAKQWVVIPGVWTGKLIEEFRRLGGDSLVRLFYEKMLILPLCLLDLWGIPYYSATQEEGWFVLTTGAHMVRIHILSPALLALLCPFLFFAPALLCAALLCCML
jgi:hypothetical protein